MYSFKEVVKFNDDYFEDKDIVAVTKTDGTVTVGRIMIGDYNGSVTCSHCLALDISEKYQQKRTFINHKDIKNIQRVN